MHLNAQMESGTVHLEVCHKADPTSLFVESVLSICGSYCGYGFHEDGIQSAAYVADLLGVKIPWDRSSNFFNRLQFKD